MTDEQWIERAIHLANSCPPSDTAFCVGAVLVSDQNRVIAEGYSREGTSYFHAEQSALSKVKQSTDLSLAVLYSSLEPCSERASFPLSCAELIIDAGVGTVCYAWSETTEHVAHPAGHAILKSNGVTVRIVPTTMAPNYIRRSTPSGTSGA